MTASYDDDLDYLGSLSLSLPGNYNQTRPTEINAAPATLPKAALFDATTRSPLTSGSLRVKVVSQKFYTYRGLTFPLRETSYGKISALCSPDRGTLPKHHRFLGHHRYRCRAEADAAGDLIVRARSLIDKRHRTTCSSTPARLRRRSPAPAPYTMPRSASRLTALMTATIATG